jgi:copper chaperone CopZ
MKLALMLLISATTGAGVCHLCPSTAIGTRSPAAPFTSVIPVASGAGALHAAEAAATLDTVALHVDGMTCGGCTIATRKVLERLDGVTKADVDYDRKRAVVTYDPSKVTVAQMITAVATLKYTATVIAPAVQSGSRSSARS